MIPADPRRLPFKVFVALALLGVLAPACGGEPDTGFSGERAEAHVRMLAETIGSRPAGSEANRRAREYVVGELRQHGFDVRVQEADASRPEFGATAHVFNIVAARRGSSPDAVALVTHYDSPPESLGAADDGLGVAVLLEAARVLAMRADPRWTLVLAVTDAEELGLMGAAALVHDPVMARVRAYLNLEAVGTTGPSLLFQAGPGNAWLVEAWARSAPSPAGNSIGTVIYERLPNDTDFTVIRQLGIPGLNFAPTGYSEAYHTPLDRAANLSRRTLQGTGDTVVSIVRALDGVDVRQRTPGEEATYFDVGERFAVVYGPATTAALAWVALALGAIAWLKMLVAGSRAAGLARLLLGSAWAIAGVVLVGLAMIAVSWLLRQTTGWLHPWYGRPALFLLLLAGTGLLAWWAVARLAALVPPRGRGCAEPACRWALTLPLWVALTGLAHASAPAAGFAIAWPLAVAGIGLIVVPARPGSAIRLVSLAVLAVSALVVLPSALRLLFFTGPVFGRLPLVMPIWVYPGLIVAFAIPLVPPLAAALPPGARRPLSSGLAGLVLAVFVVAAFLGVWATAGYSQARPHLRAARYVNGTTGDGRAVEYWEVGGNEPEPHADLLPGHPGDEAWRAVQDGPPLDLPFGRLRRAFVARVERPASIPFPGRLVAATEQSGTGSTRLRLRVAPASPTAAVVLALPPGVQPASSNFPGRVVGGRWRATYLAVPRGGVEFLVEWPRGQQADLAGARVAILDHGLPGGVGWQRLPPWLPQDREAWTVRSIFVTAVRMED